MLFINDLPDLIKFAFISLYADDLKLLCGVKAIADRKLLQDDISAVYLWSIRWQLCLSLVKLIYFHVGCRLDDHVFTCGPPFIRQSASVKDLGVIFSNNMNFREHYNYNCKKAYGLCAMIFRAFETRDMRFLIDLFRKYVRPVLEFFSHVWCPHLKANITLIEKKQRMFTKRIPCLRHLTYDERLPSSKLESLEHRRLYLDLVLYKIVHGFVDMNMYDTGVSPVTERLSLRSCGVGLNVCKLMPSQRMFCFANRACKVCNILPTNAVLLRFSLLKKYMYIILL